MFLIGEWMNEWRNEWPRQGTLEGILFVEKKDDYFGFSQLSKRLGKYGLTTQGHVLVEVGVWLIELIHTS